MHHALTRHCLAAEKGRAARPAASRASHIQFHHLPPVLCFFTFYSRSAVGAARAWARGAIGATKPRRRCGMATPLRRGRGTPTAESPVKGGVILPDSDPSTIITLNVGGTKYATTLATLRSQPGSRLSTMFSGGSDADSQQDADGAYFIDRDGATFRHVLNYLRDGTLPRTTSDEMKTEMKMEAAYYQIPQLMRWAQGDDAHTHAHQEAELVIDAFRGSAHQFLASVYGRSAEQLMQECISHLIQQAQRGQTTSTIVFYELIDGTHDWLVPAGAINGSIDGNGGSTRVVLDQLPSSSPGLEPAVEVLVQELEEKGFPCQCLSGQGLDGRVVVDIQHTRPTDRSTTEKTVAADGALMLRDLRSTAGLMLDLMRQLQRDSALREMAAASQHGGTAQQPGRVMV